MRLPKGAFRVPSGAALQVRQSVWYDGKVELIVLDRAHAGVMGWVEGQIHLLSRQDGRKLIRRLLREISIAEKRQHASKIVRRGRR